MENTFTFDTLKEKVRNRTETIISDRWSVKEETEKRITLQSRKNTNIFNLYEPVGIITNQLQNRYGSHFFVYRLRVEENEVLDIEHYNLVSAYQDELIKLKLTTVRDGVIKNRNALLKKT